MWSVSSLPNLVMPKVVVPQCVPGSLAGHSREMDAFASASETADGGRKSLAEFKVLFVFFFLSRREL